MKRVYLDHGKTAHFVLDRIWDTTFTKPALCGRCPNPWYGFKWRGTEDQAERDMAEAFPTCKSCAKKEA